MRIGSVYYRMQCICVQQNICVMPFCWKLLKKRKREKELPVPGYTSMKIDIKALI